MSIVLLYKGNDKCLLNTLQKKILTGSDLLTDPKNMEIYNQSGYQRYRQMSIDDMLLENRIIFLIGEISYGKAAEVIMKLLYLDNLKRASEISLYINSPGGSVDDTMAIYDTMRFINSPVATYCIGRAQSGGAIVLAAGTKGKRHALPHAKIMLHALNCPGKAIS